ncbi:MAG: hypothetical protein ABI446_05560 [Gemmatimonadaceae bacterium]
MDVRLRMAREELGTAYTALGDRASAARCGAELASMHDESAKE